MLAGAQIFNPGEARKIVINAIFLNILCFFGWAGIDCGSRVADDPTLDAQKL
jgi:hypothetical protein